MIPIQVITQDANPTPEVRAFVRKIAREDCTTFNMAMRGYEAMVKLIKHVAKSEQDDKLTNFQEQGFAFRILEARKTFGYALLRTVKAMEAEAIDSIHGKPIIKITRTCEIKKCKKKVDPSSYRFCRNHLPVNVATDDGDGVYCTPPPRGVGQAIKAGADKIHGRALRTMSGDFVYVPDLDETPQPEVLEE